MSTMNRRRFSLLGLGGIASATLVACGNEVGNEVAISPTQIPDVPGAPPTLADMATPGGVTEEKAPADTGGGGAAAGNALSLDAIDPFEWSETALTASPGTVITVNHTGVVPHNFAIDEFGGVLVDLPTGGDSGEWTVPDNAELGDYAFYCSIPGHRQSGMEGVLTIVEAGAAASAEGSPENGASPVADEAPAGGASAPAEAIALDAIDPFVWSETSLTASAGTVITVTNTGFLAHNFAIDEFGGVLIDLPSNLATGDWTVPADAAPGEYAFYCSIPGHRQSGMEGILTIS